ncbi:divergent PAP2 family protein [Alkaliphilus sp. B6464]|uniref:divergent PAP2 family protein n=1 Tax=Alkaliphilus sp. B6464 TaxID=2731219 RepID=UPI001BA46C2A|nr:divergent PAP2 family protein [Alkaliphilus sp. B6464]QUH20701.1 divergent PAP2 family protein [Alkaliphilus sp. B6464]
MNFVKLIGENKILWVAFLSWFIAQAIKVVHTFIKSRRIDFTRFVGSGGMPSSHASFVMGLTTAVGLTHGWDSAYFAICLCFSLVIMYDAAGVRRAVGKQAIILNKMIEDMHHKKEKRLTEKRLKELIGHTPVEVFAGAILGILLANLMI